MSTVHVPVLRDEVLEWLRIQPGGIYLDGTFGGGGHAMAIAQKLASVSETSVDNASAGRVIGVDRDPLAVEIGRQLEPPQNVDFEVYHSSYRQLPEVAKELELPLVDGILIDLGLSSDQLDCDERGFSFESAGELDLRFDTQEGEPAWKLVNRLSEHHLADLIYQYGEEKLSRRIARLIVEERRRKPIREATEFAELVKRAVISGQRQKGMQKEKIHPATRTFQALRIAVNEELEHLKQALRRLPALLKPTGRIAIISFHSLEDRMVKESFRDDDRLDVLTRKPIRPTEEEVERNRRSRSSRMRVAERNDITEQSFR